MLAKDRDYERKDFRDLIADCVSLGLKSKNTSNLFHCWCKFNSENEASKSCLSLGEKESKINCWPIYPPTS